MKAIVRRGEELVLDQWPDPQPGPGQVLVKSLACGICGSDLHALHHMDAMAAAAAKASFGEAPIGAAMDPAADMVFGHEFCAEVVDYGPGSRGPLAPGTRVCSVPMLRDPEAPGTIGYSNRWPGGFAEYMVLSTDFLLPVPNGLATEHAALTEPFAVGRHAINKVRPDKNDVFLVVGCGPIGLAIIAGLKAKGLGPVVAADFSPARRKLAETLGADILIDPAERSPYSAWADLGVPRTAGELMLVDMAGTPGRTPVIFECVGAPGMIQAVMEGAPVGARIVVVGVCMQPDQFEPFLGINKQLELHFVLGYSGEEFADTLTSIAEGELLAHPVISGEVGLAGVAQAFVDLGNPEQHCKIMVKPWA